MSVEKERPWWFGKPSQEGRYEVTVEDPFNGERTVSIAFCTRGGRLIGPSPSMKVVAWREVAEPYREGVRLGGHKQELGRSIRAAVDLREAVERWADAPVETRFYVNGQDFYTDEKSIKGADLKLVCRDLGLPLKDDDKFVFVRSDPDRPSGLYVGDREVIDFQPDMQITIDDICF